MKELLVKIREKELCPAFLAFAMFAIVALGFLLLGEDMQMLIRWDLALFLLGIAVLPLNRLIFSPFSIYSYFFAAICGLAIVSYPVWLLSRLHLLSFSVYSVFVFVIIAAVICYSLLFISYIKGKKTDSENNNAFGNIFFYRLETVISCEMAVLFIHTLSTWFLGLKIPGNQTERLMDLAFMVSIDKTDYMAPLDVWAAGNSINYYYYGHYMMTLLSKMSFVDVKYGYSLALSMIMTFGIVSIFVIVKELLSHNNINKIYSVIGGAISTIAVNFAGNCHYIVFYKLVPSLWAICGIQGEQREYWFADSTRYIGYIPENTKDRTISEFPFYSYIIGDLHAHVIDIILVAFIIALVISYALQLKNSSDKGDETDGYMEWTIAKIFNPNIIFLGFILAIVSMTNYWDYLIYYVVSGSVVLFANLCFAKKKLKVFLYTLLQGTIVYLISAAFNIPFMNQFSKMINGVGIVENRSYFHQLFIMWGLPITVVILFLVFWIDIYKENRPAFEKNNCNNNFLPSHICDLIVLLFGLCAIGLVLVPEAVFVKDIYIEGAPRANTMFKLTYQSFILFGIVFGYAVIRMFSYYHNKNEYSYLQSGGKRKLLLVLLFIWVLTLGYPFTAVKMWMGDYKALRYLGLDSSASILQSLPEEEAALEWIGNELPGEEVLLTAYGSSYTDTCIISAMSGHPTVLGWITHEWLWHNGYEFVDEREKDIDEIYNGNDVARKIELCKKYNVDYIYVGRNERIQYEDMEIALIQEIADIIYYDNSYETYIFKVK